MATEEFNRLEEEALKAKKDGFYIESLDKYETLIEKKQKTKAPNEEVLFLNRYND